MPRLRDSQVSTLRNALNGMCALTVLLAANGVAGCAAPGTDPLGATPAPLCQPGSTTPCTCANGIASTATCSADGSAYESCVCSTAPVTTTPPPAPTTSNAPGTSEPAPTTKVTDLPCEIDAIVAKNCQGCHAQSPLFGAKQALLNAADFRTPEMAANLLARLRDTTQPMPPAPNARLSEGEIASIESWLNAGAPAATCSTPTAPNTPLMPSAEPVQQEEDIECFSIVARTSAAGERYSVPRANDFYQCFEYERPWGNRKLQLVSARPIVDNATVLHHWILYNNTEDVVDGAHTSCGGAHPDAANIAGWAPGGQDLVMPPDVGLRIEPGGFTLEMHYSNVTDQVQPDASGVEICVTSKLRKHEAAVHWLGTQNLNKLSATGTCEPSTRVPVTVLSSTPHMHLQGRRMTTLIHRVDGTTETLLDEPFDFNSQVTYATPAVVNPGDTLTTRCDFATPTPFGAGTNQEMCYNFVIAYPAGGLAPDFQLFRKYNCAGF